ncbi:hypothetical protein EXT67_20705 [Pectobacterium atrosepticum]|uniref:Uncharacterized protein n=1 Tax=Pectobacterium phage phiTE TaxID=1116482 RepID=K9L3Q5_9CAUD|nr:hypothetical protein [Pectobacterium atrosepticum]YP_007392510.1 hypothetical protein phiTE_048 [Pectobacterium phage phiTE]AEZ66214.1 hypothetical protein phiTE_048 [Pectobacterium phage phiTE]MCL6318726.1 hypothetical protein [Pectobacterium atrosepticum]
MQMNDFVGNPLTIGDEVVFTEYKRHGMTCGKIIGFSKTLHMAIIEYTSEGGSVRKTKKTSGYVVKVVK